MLRKSTRHAPAMTDGMVMAAEALYLRRLGADDLAEVAALEAADGWHIGGSQAALAATLADDAMAVLGFARDADLVAYAAVARLPFEAELQAILVAAPCRGQGLARRLLAAVIEQARGWGSERLLLEVRAGNAPAISLYRAAGFVEDGRRCGYYPPLPAATSWGPGTTPPRQGGAVREDALLMSLALGMPEPE